MNILDKIEKQQIEKVLAERQIPDFSAGDTLKVNVKVVEGTRERIQAFEGVCIARKNAGVRSSFTVRKYPMERELKDYSLCIHQGFLELKLLEEVKLEELSFII
jgi:ribosomal protein L19